MYLKTLGDFGLEGNPYRGFKPLLLLTFVTLEGPRSRRELAELFWGSAANPRDSLSVAIRQLRSAAGEVIAADRDRVWSTVPSDAGELLELLDARRNDEARWRYSGPFLEGLALRLSEELEVWVYGTREVLAGRMQLALLELAERAAGEDRAVAGASLAEEAYLLRGAPELEPRTPVLHRSPCCCGRLLAGPGIGCDVDRSFIAA